MGRNERARKPLGFDVGFCWSDSMRVDPLSAAGQAVKFVAQHGNVNGKPMTMRAMVKLIEIETDPQRHARTMAEIARAQFYGCPIQLCVDIFNSADSRGEYHKFRYEPVHGYADHVARLLREIRPAQLEVANEPWYTRGQADLRMREYRDIVFEYAEGAARANWKGLLIASTRLDRPKDKVEDLWVWDVPWDHCAEAHHRLILNGPASPEELADKIDDVDWLGREGVPDTAVGWIWPVYTNETSFGNTNVDNNSRDGGAMARITLDFYEHHQTPLVLLTMSGTFDPEGGPGEWGMRSWFVDRHGNLSWAAEEMLQFVGAPSPPLIQPDPEPEPDPEPGPRIPGRGRGIGKIRKAQARLALAESRWYADGGPTQARTAIKLIEEALGRRDR
jgi:hypothetical protein